MERPVLLALATLLMLPVAWAAASRPATAQETDVFDPAAELGSVTLRVARDGAGTDYGFEAGSHGNASGSWPGELFDDGNERTVSQIWEDVNGDWHWHYSGGTAANWLSSRSALDDIVVMVIYADGRDTRSFVLGGFIAEEKTGNGLRLDPPVPDREWDDRVGQDVVISFRRRAKPLASPQPTRIEEPNVRRGSFLEFFKDTSPGGAVLTQMLLVIMVYVMFLRIAPTTPGGIFLAGLVLVLTPWFAVLLGFGSTVAAGINFLNVATGAFMHKAFVARTEG